MLKEEVMEKELFHVRISGGRRVVLPHEACNKLELGIGDTVIVEVDDDEVRLRSWKRVLREMQEYVARSVPASVSLVDELIAERRAEAARD